MQAIVQDGNTGVAKPDTILRFRRSERLLHWSIAIPFMVCYATALVLVLVYNPDPQRPYRVMFSWIHRLAGVCLIVFPLLTLLRNRADYRIHLENIRQGWVWMLDDFKWLILSGPAAISSRVALPEQGKFNAAEKLNFMTVMSTYPMFILTGVLIWLPGVAFYSWLVHFAMAALVTPLLVGHIFMATTNPSTRVGLSGMISGFVDRSWARHHYGRWYRENFGDQDLVRAERHPAEAPVAAALPAVHPPACVCCPDCGAEQTLDSWSGELGDLLKADTPPCPDCGGEKGVVTLATTLEEMDGILRQLAGPAARPEDPVPNSGTAGE